MIPHSKILNWAILLGFIAYFAMSIVFSFERILCIDNSFFFFQIINNQTFFFPENRVGVLLSQLPLLLAVKLHLSLSALVFIYSLSFIAEYTLIALLCRYVLKVREAPLIILLSLVTGVANSFFHPVTETYHSLVFATLFYALITSPLASKVKPLPYTTLIIISALWTLLAHPIGVFLIAFISVYSFYLKKISLPKTAIMLGVCVLSIIVRLALRNPESYDNQQYSSLFEHVKDLLSIHTLYPFVFIAKRITTTYLTTAVVALCMAFYLLRSRKLLEVFIIFSAAVAFCVLGILTFADGDGDIMVEKIFLPGIYMLTLPFAYNLYNTDEKNFIRYIFTGVAVLSILYSFTNIIRVSHDYTTRITRLEDILARQTHPKIIASYSDFPLADQMKFNHWNTGFDALVIAKCKLGMARTIFLTEDKTTYKYDIQDSALFLGPTWWPTWNNRDMNQTYLNLPSSTYLPFQRTTLTNE